MGSEMCIRDRCGYIDWPRERNFGPVKRKDHGDKKTKGCWDTDRKPDSRYKQTSVHFYDGARPYLQKWCEAGYADSCGPSEDPFCKSDETKETEITCKTTKKPKNPEIPRNQNKSV